MGLTWAGASSQRSRSTLRRSRSSPVFALLCASAICAWGVGIAGAAFAEEEAASKKIDLTIHDPNNADNWILPNVRFDTAWFTGFNAWAGDTRSNIGNTSNGWAEIGLVPALDGQYSLGDKGMLTGRVSGVYTTTQLGLDWGGSNFINGQTDKPSKITLEDAYLKWSSGDLLPDLGKDAVEISGGSQQYSVGNQFLFGNGGSDGGKRGGYWLGLRKASELTGIARLKTGGFSGDAVYFRTDDLHGNHTNAAGANLEYDFGKLLGLERMKLAFGYWNLFSSDDERRDGLNVIDVRFDTTPIPDFSGFGFSGEFVKEKNHSQNDSFAATGTLAYDFAANDVPCAPYLMYRIAYFQGDDQNGDNDNKFDPLYYNFNDWSEWYIGEIMGEWVIGNSNVTANIFRIRANPIESVTLNFFYIYTRLNEKQGSETGPGGRPVDTRVVSIGDKDLSHEFDFIVDWTVNDYLTTSVVAAAMVPLSGGKDFFGNDEVWGQFMLNTSIKF